MPNQTETLTYPEAGSAHTGSARLLRVLCLARNYPNPEFPRLGIWTERLVRGAQQHCEVKVISPVPYFPPMPGFSSYLRYRRVPRRVESQGVEVLHPRFLVGPGYSLHGTEAFTYSLGVNRLVGRLRGEFPFDLIHAHFTFPDGCVGARLARRYNVPLVITEQASWRPWMENYPRVKKQALQAARQATLMLPVSAWLRDIMISFTGQTEKYRVVPNAVDTSLFTPLPVMKRIHNQILFVGIPRHVKGLDLLLQAVRQILDRGRDISLVIVGEGFYESYRRELENLRHLAAELNLGERAQFVGGKPPQEVARHMKESSMLVLPSRRETFATVVVEALSCGTPVVATRCGGAEDLVNEDVGTLVPIEDPGALAASILRVLDAPQRFAPERLHAYAVERFSTVAVGRRLAELYHEAVEAHRTAAHPGETRPSRSEG